MATIQLHPEPRGSYKSPYNFVSINDKWPIFDQGGMKDTARNDYRSPRSSHSTAQLI